jgi:hypothetical protein
MYEYATKIAPFYNTKPINCSDDYSTISTFLDVFCDRKLTGGPLAVVQIQNMMQVVFAGYAERLRKPIGKELSMRLSIAGKMGTLKTLVNDRKIHKTGEYCRTAAVAAVMASAFEIVESIAKRLGTDPIMVFRFGIVVDGVSLKDLEAAAIESVDMPLMISGWEVAP